MLQYCCPQCFADGYLRKAVQWDKTHLGTCSFCLSKNQPLKDPRELQMDFQPICDLYCTGKGKSLSTQIGIDWAIWSKTIGSHARAQLLDAILGETVSKKRYCLRQQVELEDGAQKSWENFAKKIKHEYRFLLSSHEELNLSIFENYIDQFKLIEIPSKLYRARINEDQQYSARDVNEMRNPPVELAKSGRANPLGISYLYTATSPECAIHEVRPHIGAYVSVVEIQIKKPSSFFIVDLRFGDGSISPFGLGDLEGFSHERPFLKILDAEMSRAISPKRSALDYLPIQYLCEVIKSYGAGGIAYKSVVCKEPDCYNIVFFSDSYITYNTVSCYRVQSNTIGFEEV